MIFFELSAKICTSIFKIEIVIIAEINARKECYY